MTTEKNAKLVIVGDSAFAEIAYEYFTYDSAYDVVGFSVESAYLKRTELFGLPVVPFESMEERFPPEQHAVYVAITYTQLNRLRRRLVELSKRKGYLLASYISSYSFVWKNVKIGEHCFLFEDNTVQPFVQIGDNCVLWSGNHIGHHSRLGNNCFIASQAVVSGFCDVGDNSFLGVNCTLANNVAIGRDCWIGPGVTITKNCEENQLFGAHEGLPAKVPTRRFFRIKE